MLPLTRGTRHCAMHMGPGEGVGGTTILGAGAAFARLQADPVPLRSPCPGLRVPWAHQHSLASRDPVQPLRSQGRGHLRGRIWQDHFKPQAFGARPKEPQGEHLRRAGVWPWGGGLSRIAFPGAAAIIGEVEVARLSPDKPWLLRTSVLASVKWAQDFGYHLQEALLCCDTSRAL